MKKSLIKICVLMAIVIPNLVFAESEDGFHCVAIDEKYFKTTTITNNYFITSRTANSTITQEISKEEYESTNINNSISTLTSASIETTYKKLTTTISTNGNYYRYKAILMWKNMPKVRSYDTIAIGYYASVTPKGNLNFSQEYCTTAANCTTSSTFTQQIFSNGSSATFKLPSGTYISMKQTLYFDVKKNVDATIIKQIASGDYSHATKSITSTNALKLSVNDSGIVLDSSISSYYDEISPASAVWTGTW